MDAIVRDFTFMQLFKARVHFSVARDLNKVLQYWELSKFCSYPKSEATNQPLMKLQTCLWLHSDGCKFITRPSELQPL